MGLRTDLALETLTRLENSRLDGADTQTFINHRAQLEISRTVISSADAARRLGKPVGRYVTVRAVDGTFDNYSDAFKLRTHIIAREISALCGDKQNVLVAGIGNASMTPDAVGTLCARGVFATRHIKQLSAEIDTGDLNEVSVIAPGVLGQTGIEASDFIKALCERVGAATVIAVDALACSEEENLGRTIQLTDTGISPGSGVANSRKELSQATLGARCIAVGIPTVMDCDSFKTPVMVTPRSVDRLVENGARYISMSINLALQPTLSFEDIQSLV